MHATKETTAQAAAMTTWTPEQQLFFYRLTLPDITPAEVAHLFPLYLKATDAEQPPEEWRYNLAQYRAAIAPIKRRQNRGK